MIKLRFKVGPVIWEPRYTPDRRPPVGGMTRRDAIVVSALFLLFLGSAILGTVLG